MGPISAKVTSSRRWVAETQKSLGSLDISGEQCRHPVSPRRSEEFPDDKWDQIIAINMSGVFSRDEGPRSQA